MRRLVLIAAIVGLVGCSKSDDNKNQPVKTVESGSGSAGLHHGSAMRPQMPQITPPLDIKKPPADAVKTPSGLMYKKLVVNDAGTAAKKNDTVLINYTGWRQSTGETFFSNKSRGQP